MEKTIQPSIEAIERNVSAHQRIGFRYDHFTEGF